MAYRRIEHRTSRTASWTCVARAASSLERDVHYRSHDDLSLQLVPSPVRLLLRLTPTRRVFTRFLAPKGIYEYAIARTKYIDSIFKEALADRFDQILIFGAGFDTRGLRFQKEAGATILFELDVPATQIAKIRRYGERRLSLPPNMILVPIDLDRDLLMPTLEGAGFRQQARSLFVLEGVLMYLQPRSAYLVMADIARSAVAGSEVVFDYVQSAVLRREGLFYGEKEIMEALTGSGEEWRFGLEKNQVERFLAEFGLEMRDHKDAFGLERMFFTEASGRLAGRINETHCLVRARKPH